MSTDSLILIPSKGELPSLGCGLGLVTCFQWIEYSQSDVLSLQRLGSKQNAPLCLGSSLSLSHPLSGEVSCCVLGTLEQPRRGPSGT